MRQLEDWDEEYLANEIAQLDESSWLEKKASSKFNVNTKGHPDGDTREELAKQVSAFSNSGQGFLVYGIGDKSKAIDTGVPTTIGRQSLKDWIEAHIPKIVYPPVTQSECRVIHLPAFHATDKGVLVISIPLSERRPHWVTDPKEVAYIRAGAHSLPMHHQTLLDISNRGTASEVMILDIEEAKSIGRQGSVTVGCFEVFVRLLNGPICERWFFEMAVQSGPVEIGLDTQHLEKSLCRLGQEPLFPSRRTRVSAGPIFLRHDEEREQGSIEILAVLYTGSARPTCRSFGPQDLGPMLQRMAAETDIESLGGDW